jgi:hypothetical protein
MGKVLLLDSCDLLDILMMHVAFTPHLPTVSFSIVLLVVSANNFFVT